MAILAALLAAGSRFASKILTTTLGWAGTLLFGRVPASRQVVLLVVTFGSVIWAVLVIGVIVPDVGAFLLVLLPSQEVIPESVIRIVMLIGALVVPGIVGILLLWLSPQGERHGRQAIEALARGYPLTVLLAFMLVFLAVVAVVRKARSLARGWTDAHVPLIVQPGAYKDVASDLDDAISAAGLDVTPRPASAVMSSPARLLARVAGRQGTSLVPDRMVELKGPDLEILIYPMDLLISGKPAKVMRARAAMASKLTTAAAHLTVSAEAQAIEDRLASLARPTADDRPPGFDTTAAEEFASIDEALATIEIPYDEWEVLYRERLQIDRNLRAASMARTADIQASAQTAGQALRDGASAVLEAAADEQTIKNLDRIAGPFWTFGLRAAAAGAATMLRMVRRGSGS